MNFPRKNTRKEVLVYVKQLATVVAIGMWQIGLMFDDLAITPGRKHGISFPSVSIL